MRKTLFLTAALLMAATTSASAATLTVFIDSAFAESEMAFTLTDTATSTVIASQSRGTLSGTMANEFSYGLGNGDYTFLITDAWGDGADKGAGFFLSLDGEIFDDCGTCRFSSYTSEFSVTAVPLPASGLLLLGAFGAVAALRRRTGRAASL